uniref:Kinesin family member 6 n=1 Tax=Hippocampus comes TaxID=109280 RepID=A0A3Q2X9E8_HIPCM
MVKQTIQIYARIKPTKKNTAVYSVNNEPQTSAALEFVVPKDMADGFVNNKRECFSFRFQKVFDQATNQEEIFEHIAKPVADSVLAGYNGTIFAYGQTGSGKTFTITGGAERYSDRGIIPRTLSYLYERFIQDSSTVYRTHISYLEIYNEMGYDLLDSRHEASRLEDLPKVIIMEDTDQNIHLRNLSLQQSANEEEALNLLFLGDTNRMIAETPMNQASTRSHCIFTVHLCRREPGSATLRRSKLHLVDLAGSDRVSKTGLNGQLLTEAKYINLSLHYLEQVIIALSERNRCHIPYRNSMLTSVLRDSLGGNCKTTMIATMAVDKRNLDESISTCRFAQRVAVIKNEAILNEELDPALLIARLKQEVQSLKEELTMLTGEERDEQLTMEEIKKYVLDFVLLPFIDGSLTKSIGFELTSGVQTGIGYTCGCGSTSYQLTHFYQKFGMLRATFGWTVVEVDVWSESPCLSLLTGAQLSVGKQEAFETFIKDHEDHHIIEDNKSLLKQRSTEARKLGEQLHDAKQKISVIGNHKDVGEEVDPVEENLREHIEQEKKTSACHLKALRTEIEHLQLLLERAKVKLHKDFQKWWNEEASNVQVSEKQNNVHIVKPHEALRLCFRALSKSSLSPSSIPLTGDRQADADILAFIRARQNLLSRAGNTQTQLTM